MKQIEATVERPFYSVGFTYRGGHTVYSCNAFGKTPLAFGYKGKTMPGTDDVELAKMTARGCLKSAGVTESWVHVTTDCYNHKEVAHFTATN